MRLVLALVTAGLTMTGGLPPVLAQTLPRGMVGIDGKKNPERIPDYLVWASVFRTVGGLKSAPPFERGVIIRSLHMSDDEVAIALRASEAQLARTAQCEQRILKRQKELVDAQFSRADADLGSRGIELTCRLDTLEASERLLNALSFSGRVALSRWVEVHRASITVYVAESEMQWFRTPR